ncbi:coil containing protein [Vibrio phage 1.042.O._10N.286.45.B8]|nr:coil containing protein [Vibrio phage 1.042.O._10N.286.45.B8]
MLSIFTDIETLPEPNGLDAFVESAKGSIKVPSTLTKPKLIEALGLGADAKYKTVDELKGEWIEKFATAQAKIQGEQEWRKTSFDGSKGEICVICPAIEDGEILAFSQMNMSEAQMLREFWQWLSESIGMHEWRFVAHYAKFDIPFIWHRSVINNVNPNVYFNPHARHGRDVFCTVEAWCGYGNRISLDNLSKALGVQSKTEGMNGSKVYDTWITKPEDVVSYCVQDVTVLRDVYKRINFL